MTTEQVRNSRVGHVLKDVTRRLGWWFLLDTNLEWPYFVRPVVKCMGLKKGEKVQPIRGPIRIVSARGEPLNCITQEEVVREGFPDKDPEWFIDMMVNHCRCPRNEPFNRIEFEYTDLS